MAAFCSCEKRSPLFERCRAEVATVQYHFVIAMWRAKEAESRAYENDNSPIKHSMNRSHCPLALLLIPLAFACFALAPTARAVSPPPDGER
jgi:hypothetical protein